MWVSVGKIRAQASEQMGAHNVVLSRDGMRVGVRHMEDEKYVDATQSWVVKAWNLSGSGVAKSDKAKRYVYPGGLGFPIAGGRNGPRACRCLIVLKMLVD